MPVKESIKPNPRLCNGVQDEPKQLLRPIAGYEQFPLLSLEDACYSLTSIVSDIEHHVRIAKENSKHPIDNLSCNESAAIYLYTMEWQGSLYTILNATLCKADRDKLIPWFLYLRLFLTALYKLPDIQTEILWRGIKLDLSKAYKVGERFAWWAFSSCSRSSKVLEQPMYLGTTGKRTLFSIQTLHGKSIRNHSSNKNEEEILLMPGAYFQVSGQVSPVPDLHIVQLKQTEPPHVLLETPLKIQKEPMKLVKSKSQVTENKNSTNGINASMVSTEPHVIDFSTIPNAISKWLDIPNGYEGFNWTNFRCMDEETGRKMIFSGEKWRHRFMQQKVLATSKDLRGDYPMTIERTNGEYFTLGSIEVTSTWYNGTIIMSGTADGRTLYKKSVNIYVEKSTMIKLNWIGIQRFAIEDMQHSPISQDGVLIYSITIGNVATSSAVCSIL